jgi:hypothetical protein
MHLERCEPVDKNLHTGSMTEPAKITGARQGGRLTAAGIRAGHLVEVEHGAKRFRLVCPCGWHSDARWTRKRTFFEASQHVILAGKAFQEGAPPVPARVVPEIAIGPEPAAPVHSEEKRVSAPPVDFSSLFSDARG